MRSRGIGIGIPFFSLKGIPFRDNLLRFLRPRTGIRIYDIIGSYDAEETALDVYDMNPDDLSDPDIELQIMDRSDVAIWSETDKDGNTIRDLPGYNPLDPFEWLDAELNVDIFNTYINLTYIKRIFANFFGTKTDLAIYDKVMTCVESTRIHAKLQTGKWWILNRGSIGDCGIIKPSGVIWSV